jgi:hypothetical protein
MSKEIDAIIHAIIEGGLAKPEDFSLVDEDLIELLEINLHTRFPPLIKEYLLRLGNNPSKELRSCLSTFPHIFEDRSFFFECLQFERNRVVLESPTDILVFFINERTQFLFIYCNQGDNPLVYQYYQDNDGEPITCKNKTFTDYMIYFIREYSDLVKRVNSRND